MVCNVSTTKLIEEMNLLSNTEFSRESWSALVPQLIAVTLTKKGFVADGLLLLESFNRKTVYFYFNLATKKYSLGR